MESPKSIIDSASIANSVKLSHPHSYQHSLRVRQSSLSVSIFRYYLPSCLPIRFHPHSRGTSAPESRRLQRISDLLTLREYSSFRRPSHTIGSFSETPFYTRGTLEHFASHTLGWHAGSLSYPPPCEEKLCKRNVTSPLDHVEEHACLRSNRNNRPTVSDEKNATLPPPWAYPCERKKKENVENAIWKSEYCGG